MLLSQFRFTRKREGIIGEISEEMSKYRFIMHPFRLSMMKLLYDNYKMSSIDIKEALKLSWADYSNFIKSLKKKEYVSIKEEFDEDSKRQFVYLEEAGRRDYENLVNLLNKFLDKSSEIYPIDSTDDELYPPS